MNRIQTYIINLEKSVVRKEYMNDLLRAYSFLDIHYVKGVEGKKLSESEISERFDKDRCLKRYGRALSLGEIGCTLSHRECYEKLLSTSFGYALILEDDIHPMRDLSELLQVDIDNILDNSKPTILFLSGDYWYLNHERQQSVVSVFSAVGSYAYFINRAAAKCILSIKRPYYTADDWMVYKTLGVRLKAVRPYLIDANVDMDLLGSDVLQDQWGINRKLMSCKNVLESYTTALMKRVLSGIGHFESKIRVINNKVVS